jgi:hypothetical protein
LKNALTTAKKLGIAVDDIFRNSRPGMMQNGGPVRLWGPFHPGLFINFDRPVDIFITR